MRPGMIASLTHVTSGGDMRLLRNKRSGGPDAPASGRRSRKRPPGNRSIDPPPTLITESLPSPRLSPVPVP